MQLYSLNLSPNPMFHETDMSTSSTRPTTPTLRLFRSLWGLAVDPRSASASTSPSYPPSPQPPPCRGIKSFPSRQALLRHVARAGGRWVGGEEGGRKGGLYQGIEASLCDLGSTKEERRDMVRVLEEQGLDLIIGKEWGGRYMEWIKRWIACLCGW